MNLAKRIFDLSLAMPVSILLLPVMVVIAIWIRLDSDGPALFRQLRVGQFGRPFHIFKFRTMYVNSDVRGPRLTSKTDTRVTRAGRFLRRTKLDELPQLLNVIAGQMSLVGPRPEVPEFVARYPAAARQLVLSVPPGITDLAAIEFRDEGRLLEGCADPVETYVSRILPVKLAYYVNYVQTRSIAMDAKLVLRTLLVLLRDESRRAQDLD